MTDLPVALIGPDVAKRGDDLQNPKLQASVGHDRHIAAALIACTVRNYHSKGGELLTGELQLHENCISSSNICGSLWASSLP